MSQPSGRQESRRTAHHRADKSLEVGIRQTQTPAAPGGQAKHRSEISQAQNRRQSDHQAKGNRWLRPWTGRVGPEASKRVKTEGKVGEKTDLYACTNL